MSFQARRASAADARGIAETRIESWRATYAGLMPQAVLDALDVETNAAFWERAVESEESATFVAERGGVVVAFASAGPAWDLRDTGQVYAIYARPAVWGQGSGRAVMDAAVTWLAERWDEAVLWVAEENARGRRFYDRYGWRPDGARQLDEPVPGAVVAEIRYRLSLLGRG